MKRSPILIALLQVLGVVAYILLFVATANHLSNIFRSIPDQPIVDATFFLLAFVTSALICGSLVLGYPLYIFLSGEKRKAVMVVLYTAVWFMAALLLMAVVVLLTQANARYMLFGR